MIVYNKRIIFPK